MEKNESKSDAALRETNEEIEHKTTIEIVGNLTPLYVPVSNFRIYPFVAAQKNQIQLFTIRK